MNAQELKQLLNNAKEDPSASPQQIQLIQSLEDFIDLYYGNCNSENMDKEKFVSDLTECHRVMEESLEAVAATHGVSGEFLKNYTSDPNNFTQEQWSQLSQWKTDILSINNNGLENKTATHNLQKTKKQKIKA